MHIALAGSTQALQQQLHKLLFLCTHGPKIRMICISHLQQKNILHSTICFVTVIFEVQTSFAKHAFFH